MGFRKWVAGFLGFGNHENNDENDNGNNNNSNLNSDEEINHHHHHSNSNRKGFSVQVPVDKVHQIGPVLIPCVAGDGGLQGLGWYTKRLRVDEDGDVADEFLDEVFPETTAYNTEVHHKQVPKFEVKSNTKSAKARNPILSREGTIQQFVEYRGRFLLA